MMSYRYDSKKKGSKKWLVVVITLFVVSLTSLPQHLLDLVERALVSGTTTLRQNISETQSASERLLLANKLQEENEQLKRRNNILEVDAYRLEYLTSVLESYEAFSNIDANIIPAQVLRQYPYIERGVVYINVGSRNDIEVGDVVLTQEKVLLGEVLQVFDTSSLVELYTHASKESLAVSYPQEELLTLEGTGLAYRSSLERDSGIEVGDIVMSQEYPGYILGVVREIEFDPRDPFKNAVISLPIDHHISSVGVLKK